jgi:hypothetical protein
MVWGVYISLYNNFCTLDNCPISLLLVASYIANMLGTFFRIDQRGKMKENLW